MIGLGAIGQGRAHTCPSQSFIQRNPQGTWPYRGGGGQLPNTPPPTSGPIGWVSSLGGVQCTESKGARALASPVRYWRFGARRVLCSLVGAVSVLRELPSQSAAQMGPCSLPLARPRFVVGEHRGRRASWRLVYGAKGGGVGVCRRRRCKVSRRRPKMKLSLTIARVSDSGSVLLGVLVLS